MKNLHSAGNFYKRTATLSALIGSLILSASVFSKPSCDALHTEAIAAQNAYLSMSIACQGFEYMCMGAIKAKAEIWVIADAAWRTCEGS